MLNAECCSKLGIRREDKNEWEERVPLVPEDILEFREKHSIETIIQPSQIRIFSDQDYKKVGVKVQEDLSPADVIFAIKEIPTALLQRNKTYIFFSHTTKGQSHNMPMLKRILKLKCQLIDYEKIMDSKGKRLIFFGRYAGLAGMIDTLWALGKRLEWEGISTPFSKIKQTYLYKNLKSAKHEIAQVGKEIKINGLPNTLQPFIFGFTGYGHVSQGAQEILDLLPVQEITPPQILSISTRRQGPLTLLYKVVFQEKDIVELTSPWRGKFELQDYYNHPDKYNSIFYKYIPHLNVLVNCIYWTPRYSKLVTKEYLAKLFSVSRYIGIPRLRVIGDLSCDVEGSIECTLYNTNPGDPVFVYDPLKKTATSGYTGRGIVILAIDNLPCELARESSIYFSSVLKEFVPEIMCTDYSISFEQCNLPSQIKNAIIVWKGKLTPKYKYLEKYL